MDGVVLVGNGRSLLEREGLGAAIDRFARVVRFNDFRTEGFEACVGARTDWWARNEMPPAAPRRERFRRIVVRPRMEDAACYDRTKGEVEAELASGHPGTPVEWVARETYLDLCEGYGHRGSPLTGTLVAAHLLRRFRRLHVCGFDGLGGGEEARRHYFSEGDVVGDWDAYHDHERDARWLRDREAEGRIVRL